MQAQRRSKEHSRSTSALSGMADEKSEVSQEADHHLSLYSNGFMASSAGKHPPRCHRPLASPLPPNVVASCVFSLSANEDRGGAAEVVVGGHPADHGLLHPLTPLHHRGE